jgi:hypothetical protein
MIPLTHLYDRAISSVYYIIQRVSYIPDSKTLSKHVCKHYYDVENKILGWHAWLEFTFVSMMNEDDDE